MKSITLTMDVPPELEERLRALGPVQWGHTGSKPDSAHVEEFANSLSATREHFATEGDADLQGVYVDGSDVVVAHTGTSPNSANHARILVGLWNALHDSLGGYAPEDAGLTNPQVEALSGLTEHFAETAPLADREKSADPSAKFSREQEAERLSEIHWELQSRLSNT